MRAPSSVMETSSGSSKRPFVESPYYPGDVKPEDLGDGVVIQKAGDWKYFVHERSEVGVGRFSPLSRSFHLTLRGAVRRFIKHYRLSCKAYGLRLRRWG